MQRGHHRYDLCIHEQVRVDGRVLQCAVLGAAVAVCSLTIVS